MNSFLEKFKDIHEKILPKLVYILNIEGYTLIFSLIFFISFIIFFFKIEGSEQLKNILSETITYGYIRYLKKDEIKNIKENMFTSDNDTFNEISFYVKKISKLYETYNYKILMKWYDYLHVFYKIMFVFIILDIIYGIHYNNEKNFSNKSKLIKPIILGVLFLVFGIYLILQKRDNDNFKKDFNNIITNADNIKKNIEQSVNIPNDKKKELISTLETLKNNYNKTNSNENFINYSNNVCYEQNTSSSMLKNFFKFVMLFIIIFIVYYSISLIVSITNHINLKNSFNSLLIVVCILAVVEILYFLVVVMKILKDKVSSILKKVNYSLIDEYKSISNQNNNSNYIIHHILDSKNILQDMVNNENIENNQNNYKNNILNKIEKYNNIIDSVLQNSSINNEYNIKSQNKRVLCIIIILLTMLLIFFYYNNNKKYNVLYRTNNIADIFKMFLTIMLNNKYEIFGIILLLIFFIIFINKYYNLKQKEKERAKNIK